MRYYRRLKSGQKVSLNRSMVVMTKKFLEEYNWNVSYFQDYESLLTQVYFHWLRNSAEKNYSWCESFKYEFLSKKFANEMMKRLDSILKKQLKKKVVAKKFKSVKKSF